MDTYGDLVRDDPARPRLPSSGWATSLRGLPVRPAADDQGETVITCQARELSALTSGHRRWLAVALAELPDLTDLGRRLGDKHLQVVVVDNRQRSRAKRMTEANRQRRIDALRRRIDQANRELAELGEPPYYGDPLQG